MPVERPKSLKRIDDLVKVATQYITYDIKYHIGRDSGNEEEE